MALFSKLPSWASILITVIAAVIVVGLVSWGTYALVKPTPRELPEGEDLECQNLWWYDNTHRYCQQKQFCGAYMYEGLKTFSTKEECESDLKKESTTNWKTYRNEEHGFEFKYPDEIDIKEATNKLGKEMVLSFKPCTELPSNETTYCKTTIKTLTSEESLTNFIAKEFHLDKFSLGQQDGPEGVYIEKATINGGDIESYKISVPGMLPFTNYYTKNKDRLIIITNGFIWYGTELEKIGISGWNLFNQILSTFKFLD